MPGLRRRAAARLAILCALAAVATALAAAALERRVRGMPPAVPLVVVLVPHLGAAELRDRLHAGDLTEGGLRRLAFASGLVVRELRPVDPATSTAMAGALLSGRSPASTGVTTRMAPDPHRRCSQSREALSFRALGASMLRARPLRPTLGAGLESGLLPLHADRWAVHVHGQRETGTLDPGATEDPQAAGWRLAAGRNASDRLRALSLSLSVTGDVEPEIAHVVDLLMTPDASGQLELVAVCRDRDEISGRLRRCGSGHVVESAVECVDSGLYHERAHALLEVSDGAISISAHTHPSTTPPALAARLGAIEVIQRPGGGRWRDAETIAALSAAVALGEHQRLIALLDGPETAAEIEGLDRRLGALARSTLASGGTLIVIGLNGGHDLARSVDLPRDLPEALPPGLAARVRVHAEDGHARVDLCRPTLSGRAALETAIRTLVGDDARLRETRPGVLLVTAAPGVDLSGRVVVTAAYVAGRDPGDPRMAGTVFSVGRGVPRLAVPELPAVELSRLLGELWRSGAAGSRWPQ